MTDKQKGTLRAYLATQKLCVLTTCGEQTPQAALVGFAETKDFTLYFQTSETSRKAHNLTSNQQVAIVIGTNLEAAVTVQYEGVAEEVLDGDEKATCRQLFVDKASPSVRFSDLPTTKLYKIKPTWIRYSNYAGGPPQVFETSDF